MALPIPRASAYVTILSEGGPVVHPLADGATARVERGWHNGVEFVTDNYESDAEMVQLGYLPAARHTYEFVAILTSTQ